MYEEHGKSCTDKEENNKLPRWNESNRIIPLDSLLNQYYFKCHGSLWKKKGNSAYGIKLRGNRKKWSGILWFSL